MSILIFGASGSIGQMLLSEDRLRRNCLVGISRNSSPLIEETIASYDPHVIKSLLTDLKPAAVVFLVAISSLPECASDPFSSFLVNVGLPDLVSSVCSELDIPFLFTSTDYVYNGFIQGPKNTLDSNLAPLSLYATQKLLAERRVLDNSSLNLVLRIGRVYSPSSASSFLSKLIKNFKMNDVSFIADDQFFSALNVTDLYNVILAFAERNITGLFNCGGLDAYSIYEYALILARSLDLDVVIKPKRLAEIIANPSIPLDVTLDSNSLFLLIPQSRCSFKSFLNQNVVLDQLRRLY